MEADVVGFVAQLDLAGMHPNAQSDRRQRSALQIQGAGHGVAGAGERDDKTVALTLFDWSYTVCAATTSARVRSRRATAADMASGWVCHNRVEPSTSARSNVTVPVGSNSFTPSSLQST